ncbi:hypothetical protein J437_LFUL010214 [Ladona fulva]|uniref:Uncharacterized protein n=1 Tax=Ladona fulva TaxID=123851 RepID=A0A8K0KDJ0_LADFU|nr:hypothetical protein J437_LFUL010214 [Ladona fulva]
MFTFRSSESFIGVKMDLSLSILCVALIHLSYGQTEPELTERTTTLGDLVVERSHSHKQDVEVNFTHKVDICKGTVAARFHILKPHNYTNYEIELQVFKDINNETCLGNLSNEEKHSMIKLDSIEDGEVVFRHVFSGCYRWKIEAYTDKTSYQDLYTDLIYIVTNVPKRKITKEGVRVPHPTHNCKKKLYS